MGGCRDLVLLSGHTKEGVADGGARNESPLRNSYLHNSFSMAPRISVPSPRMVGRRSNLDGLMAENLKLAATRRGPDHLSRMVALGSTFLGVIDAGPKQNIKERVEVMSVAVAGRLFQNLYCHEF